MGTVVEQASVMIPGTKLRSSGPLLITHWGMSGPAILKISSYAARLLAEHQYQMPLCVNWTGLTIADAEALLYAETVVHHPQKQLSTFSPLWTATASLGLLLEKALSGRGVGEME